MKTIEMDEVDPIGTFSYKVQYKDINGTDRIGQYSGSFKSLNKALAWYDKHGKWLEDKFDRSLMLFSGAYKVQYKNTSREGMMPTINKDDPTKFDVSAGTFTITDENGEEQTVIFNESIGNQNR